MIPANRPILVLGGGINGAAIARELTLNGVSVWLVDQGDLSGGATAYSSRLIHGGLRYLEYGEYSLVRESLAERNRLLATAADLVRPLKLYIPVRRRLGGLAAAAVRFLHAPSWIAPPTGSRGLWLVRAGLAFYDQFARRSTLPPHSVHELGEARVPQVDAHAFRWVCAYHDAQLAWPERFVIALLRDAQRFASTTGSDLRVLPYHTARRTGDRVVLSRRDARSGEDGRTIGEELEIEPAAIVNATGAWVDTTLAQLQFPSRRLMGGTKGSHFVTYEPALRRALGDGGVYAEAHDGRPVFLLPFGPATVVGTTDLPFTGDPADAVASYEELDYLIQATRTVFPHISLSSGDVTLHYSGVRPLPYVASGATAGITRRHWLEPLDAGPFPIYSVIGGKLTTCRSLAEQTAQQVLARLDRDVVRNSRDRLLADAADAPTLASLATSEIPAAAVVERIVREEWVTGLEDLAERRLLLHFRRSLTLADLRRLADQLVSQGRIAATKRDDEVARCRTRFERHFGRRFN